MHVSVCLICLASSYVLVIPHLSVGITLSIGIVSGLKRCPKIVGIPDKLGALDYIQTDAGEC